MNKNNRKLSGLILGGSISSIIFGGLEMAADTNAMSRQFGEDDALDWYSKNKNKIILHPSSREKLEEMIGYKKEMK